MTWTALTFAFGSVLTSTKMTQLFDNITAAFNKDSSAPTLATNYIVEAMIAASAVTQSKLKTTSGTQSVTADSSGITDNSAQLALPGGAYGFYPQLAWSQGTGSGTSYSASIAASTGAGSFSATTYILLSASTTPLAGINVLTASQRYVQSSPPWFSYRPDDPIHQFIFALIDRATNKVIASTIAEDPPWANNGPTICNPIGLLQRLAGYRMSIAWTDVLADHSKLEAYMLQLELVHDYCRDPKNEKAILTAISRKLTQEEKNADMSLIPHPFVNVDASRHQVVVISPTDNSFSRALMARTQFLGDSLPEILHGGFLEIDNSPMRGLATPPGVMAVSARLKPTRA